jgi:hypothetical protein
MSGRTATGSRGTAAKVARATIPARRSGRLRLPDGSRSVQSVWVWRGFLFMSLIALGLCISFAAGGMTSFAVAWLLITIGWFAISMWLWRKHVQEDDLAWRTARKRGGGRSTAS